MYTHLNRKKRIALGALLYAGHNQADIARELKVHPSTISRELKRNQKSGGGYHSTHAYVLSREKRKKSKAKYRKIENDEYLEKEIESRLHPLISPETIAHDLDISHETIYSWIYRSRPELKEKLPQRGRKRRTYGSKREKKQGWTKNVRVICERDTAKECFEGDTVKGSTKPRLLTHVDQKSLFTVADLMPDGTADSVHAVMKKKNIDRDILYDRGSEFALWQMIERDTDATIYFADPHSPWQRSKNENTNGRLRRVYPKKFDFSSIKQRDVDCVIHLMNHTKRKSLYWRTPCEVYGKCCTSG